MPRQPQISALENPGLFFGRPLYALEGDWTFTVAGHGSFTIPSGYRFDGASVPQVLWGFPFGYTPFGVHIGAALEHDWLCEKKVIPHTAAHAHFYRRLQEDGLRPGQAWMMGRAVQLFGPRWKMPVKK